MKIRIATLAVVMLAAVAAKAQFVIENTNGTQSATTKNNVTFTKYGSTWRIGTIPLENIQSISLQPLGQRLENYKGPTYADDYRNITSWNNRTKWNLANIHDPTVMRAADGYYYMYQTDASFGNVQNGHGHFHGRRSRNLVDWDYLGATMNSEPTWVKDTVNSYRAVMGLDPITTLQLGYWAPCARRVNDSLYRMYYCIVVDNFIKTGAVNTAANFDGSWTERALIGLMETTDPATNKWTDKGFVIGSSTDKGRDGWNRTSYTGDWNGYFKFNAIDPTFIITPEGEHWLIYGSWHSGFAAVQLDPETGKTLQPLGYPWGDISAYGKTVATRGGRWQGSEGPEVVYHDGYYYLFMAYDGLDVPYNTRVARSRHINGPYYGRDGVNITQGGQAFPVVTHPYKFGDDTGWVGISHCAVFEDGEGNYFYCSQQRFPTDGPGWSPNAVMMGGVRAIRWVDEWPVVMPERYGAVPQVPVSEEELTGQWQVIALTYNLNQQDASVEMQLKADHTVSGGPLAARQWSLNGDILTIGTVNMAVSREPDWERSGRPATIVFAGTSLNGRQTYWAKRTGDLADTEQ